MMQEITYEPYELESGKCTSCGEYSNEILIGDGRCVDCIEAEKFYNETMKDVGKRSPFDMES
jgi:hypothetical protein